MSQQEDPEVAHFRKLLKDPMSAPVVLRALIESRPQMAHIPWPASFEKGAMPRLAESVAMQRVLTTGSQGTRQQFARMYNLRKEGVVFDVDRLAQVLRRDGE